MALKERYKNNDHQNKNKNYSEFSREEKTIIHEISFCQVQFVQYFVCKVY
jgi:hypothetical protein